MMAFREDDKTPLFWDMARRCLDFDGKPRHFPRGSYSVQMATKWGRLEMNRIELLWTMSKTFSRWAKGFEYYKKTKDMDLFDLDERRIEALESWYAEKEQVSS